MTSTQTPRSSTEDDFELVRRIKHGLLIKGEEALEDMIEVARATEHPRAYEVLSNMIKNVSDAGDSLIDIHKKKHDMEKKEVPAIPQTTNNNVFVGSTTDLQRMLMKDITPIDQTDE